MFQQVQRFGSIKCAQVEGCVYQAAGFVAVSLDLPEVIVPQSRAQPKLKIEIQGFWYP